MGGGQAKALIKTCNKKGIPATLFIIFTSGGIDFVGGFSFYQFLMHNLPESQQQSTLVQKKLGQLTLSEQNGEEIHAKLFEKCEVKVPAYWKQVVSYF